MKRKFLIFLACGTAVITSMQTITAQSWNITGNNNTTGLSKLGTTNFIPLNLVTNDSTRLRIDEIGRVGIGTTSPVNILTVKSTAGNPTGSWLSGLTSPVFVGFADNASSEFVLATASNISPRRSVIQGRRSRGTLAAPTVVANNDYLTSFLASGYDGSVFQNPATIDFFVDGVPSAGNVPARISFVTGTNQANRQERLKVGSTGNFNFNGNQLTLQESSGDIGVGTGNLRFSTGLQTIQFPNPAASSNAMINMFVSGTTNTDRMVIGHSPAYPDWGLQYQDNADKFNFLSNGTSVLTADLASQRVGIGTANPLLAKLVVEGTAGGNTVALFRGSATGKGLSLVTDYPGVYFNSYWNAGQKALSPGYAGILNFDPVLGHIFLGTSATAATGAGNTIAAPPALLITKEANVGIGTSAPTARLHVVGNSAVTTPVIQATNTYAGNVDVRGISSVSTPADGYGYGIHATGGYRGGYLFGDGGAYTGSTYGVLGIATGTAGTRVGVYGSASGGTVNNWGGYFPTKTYTSELRVGGVDGAAGYVAAINGKLIATEVRVELIANWPDYVFNKDYTLLPIEDLEASINKNKHLPGIPAASQMKENGIMLGEMQTKTIEKLEEATLYIIQLNNKIRLLEEKIEALTKRMK